MVWWPLLCGRGATSFTNTGTVFQYKHFNRQQAKSMFNDSITCFGDICCAYFHFLKSRQEKRNSTKFCFGWNAISTGGMPLFLLFITGYDDGSLSQTEPAFLKILAHQTLSPNHFQNEVSAHHGRHNLLCPTYSQQAENVCFGYFRFVFS